MSKYFAYSCLLSIILLPSCTHKYTIKQLEPLAQQELSIFKETQDDIALHVKKIPDYECVDLFGNRARRIVRGKNPLVPVQISVSNNSENNCIISPKNIRLSIVASKHIAYRLQSSSLRVALTSLGIFVSLGVVTGITGYVMLNAAYTGAAAWVGTAGAATMIASIAIIYGTPFFMLKASAPIREENRAIKKYLKKTGLSDSIVVEPGETINAMFFVRKKDWHPNFALAIEKIVDMQTKNHEDVWFNVCLPN